MTEKTSLSPFHHNERQHDGWGEKIDRFLSMFWGIVTYSLDSLKIGFDSFDRTPKDTFQFLVHIGRETRPIKVAEPKNVLLPAVCQMRKRQC